MVLNMYFRLMKRCVLMEEKISSVLLQSCPYTYLSEKVNSPCLFIKRNVYNRDVGMHTSASFSKDNKKSSSEISVWTKFMNTIRIFSNGVKQIYREGKLAREIQARMQGQLKVKREAPTMINGKLSVPYSREELQCVHRVC